MIRHELVEDYTLSPVPEAETLSGWHITIVVTALGFTLPVFEMGIHLVHSMGWKTGILSCILGCLFSGTLSLPASIVGARVRLSTYLIMKIVFGEVGGKCINFIFSLVLIGWFANVADLLGSLISVSLLSDYSIFISKFTCTSLIILLTTLTGIFGFKVMEKFSMIVVPILCFFMFWVLVRAVEHTRSIDVVVIPPEHPLSIVSAISAVMGLVVLQAVLAPDFTRYARNDRAAIISNVGLTFGYPIIMILSAIPSILMGENDLMQVMMELNLGSLAIFLLIISTWSSNTGNIYCATLTIATLLPKAPVWFLGVGIGCISVLAAFFHISEYFFPFLIALSIAVTPIAGVYICCFFFSHGHSLDAKKKLESASALRNICSWLFGAIVGYLSEISQGFIIPVPPVEGLLVSVIMWFFLKYIKI